MLVFAAILLFIILATLAKPHKARKRPRGNHWRLRPNRSPSCTTKRPNSSRRFAPPTSA